ncbi:unnamed protein product [Effrenium voratum]|uniref:Uncharacterized protein n=1 Tax=Effrenium voratum TaxID=2562239 RepID=A0AA36IVW1_9DINO|nr:unnamed protein product [Effrenium voratum]
MQRSRRHSGPLQTLQGFSAYLTEADVLMLQDEAMAPLKQDNVSRGGSQSLFDLDVITPSKQGNMRAEQQCQVMSAAYSRRAAEKPAEDLEAEGDTAPVTPPKEGRLLLERSRPTIKRSRDDALDINTPFGTLLLSQLAPLAPTTAGGTEESFEFTFVNPLAWMYHLCATCTQYADLVKNMFQARPKGRRGPLAAMPGMAVGCGLQCPIGAQIIAECIRSEDRRARKPRLQILAAKFDIAAGWTKNDIDWVRREHGGCIPRDKAISLGRYHLERYRSWR